MFHVTHPFVVEGSIYDNIYLHKDAIDAYEATLTPDERECRLYGKPLHKAGLIYKCFQRDRHVLDKLPLGWTLWVEPPASWSYYLYDGRGVDHDFIDRDVARLVNARQQQLRNDRLQHGRKLDADGFLLVDWKGVDYTINGLGRSGGVRGCQRRSGPFPPP